MTLNKLKLELIKTIVKRGLDDNKFLISTKSNLEINGYNTLLSLRYPSEDGTHQTFIITRPHVNSYSSSTFAVITNLHPLDTSNTFHFDYDYSILEFFDDWLTLLIEEEELISNFDSILLKFKLDFASTQTNIDPDELFSEKEVEYYEQRLIELKQELIASGVDKNYTDQIDDFIPDLKIKPKIAWRDQFVGLLITIGMNNQSTIRAIIYQWLTTLESTIPLLPIISF